MKLKLIIGLLFVYNLVTAQIPENTTAILTDKLEEQFREFQRLSDKFNNDLAKIKESIILKTAKKHSFSALGGYAENGFSILGSYNFYNSNKLSRLNNFIELSILASYINEDQSSYEIPIQNYTLNAGYFIRIPMLSGTLQEITTTIGLGGIIGYESINSNTTVGYE